MYSPLKKTNKQGSTTGFTEYVSIKYTNQAGTVKKKIIKKK